MIRTFDRYFLMIALTNIVLAAVGVTALYVLIDYLYNVETFSNYGLAEVFEHYAFNVPPVLYMLGPMIALMGTSFGISRILKNREILPLACGGLRSFRSLRMFWVAALLAGMALLAARIWVLPAQEEALQGSGSAVANLRKATGEAVSLRDDEGNFWHIGKFDLVEGHISDVTLIVYGADGLPSKHLRADMLTFSDKRWRGEQRIINLHQIADQSARKIVTSRAGPILESSLLPNAIVTRGVKRTYRTPQQLRAMIAELPHRHDLRVAYYQIFAWPLLTLAMVLAGAVIALRLELRNIVLAAALTITLAFGVFAMVLVLEKMATKGSISPEVGVLALPLALLAASLCGLRWFAD